MALVESATDGYVKLGKYGTVGVMLALVALNAVAIWMIYSLASTYIAKSMDTMERLAATTSELSTLIRVSNNRLSLKQ